MARMAAGIQLKNTLASNNPKTKLEYQQRWLAFPSTVRDYVKLNVSIQFLIAYHFDEFSSLMVNNFVSNKRVLKGF